MLIGPNSCAYCGGEYGEHEADCTRPQEEPKRVIMSTDTAWKVSVQSGQQDGECVLRIHDTRYTGQVFLVSVSLLFGRQMILRGCVTCENLFLEPAPDMIDMLITVSKKFLGIFEQSAGAESHG